MKKFEARVTKLRQTPGLDADPDVKERLIMTMILLIRMMMTNQTSVFNEDCIVGDFDHDGGRALKMMAPVIIFMLN